MFTPLTPMTPSALMTPSPLGFSAMATPSFTGSSTTTTTSFSFHVALTTPRAAAPTPSHKFLTLPPTPTASSSAPIAFDTVASDEADASTTTTTTVESSGRVAAVAEFAPKLVYHYGAQPYEQLTISAAIGCPVPALGPEAMATLLRPLLVAAERDLADSIEAASQRASKKQQQQQKKKESQKRGAKRRVEHLEVPKPRSWLASALLTPAASSSSSSSSSSSLPRLQSLNTPSPPSASSSLLAAVLPELASLTTPVVVQPPAPFVPLYAPPLPIVSESTRALLPAGLFMPPPPPVIKAGKASKSAGAIRGKKPKAEQKKLAGKAPGRVLKRRIEALAPGESFIGDEIWTVLKVEIAGGRSGAIVYRAVDNNITKECGHVVKCPPSLMFVPSYIGAFMSCAKGNVATQCASLFSEHFGRHGNKWATAPDVYELGEEGVMKWANRVGEKKAPGVKRWLLSYFPHLARYEASSDTIDVASHCECDGRRGGADEVEVAEEEEEEVVIKPSKRHKRSSDESED